MNKKVKGWYYIVFLLITAILFATLLSINDKVEVTDTVRYAVPLSQNPTAATSLDKSYYTPEGVVLLCDERHGFASRADGQFLFGLNDEEIAKSHLQDKDFDWRRARVSSNGQIIAAFYYNMDGILLHIDTPKNTRELNDIKIISRYFWSDCKKFVLYIKYNDTIYSADCTIARM